MRHLSKAEGGALIVVLLLSVALASISALLIVKTKSHTERIRIAKEFLQAERRLQSDLSAFIYETQTSPFFIMGNSSLAPEYTSSFPDDTNLFNLPFIFGESDFQVQDAGGVVHLVPFNEGKVRKYLAVKGWPEDQIRNFIDTLSDWVDKDVFERLHGAESDDYGVRGFPLNNELQSKYELSLLKNVDKQLLNLVINDDNLILYNPGRESADYTPDELLSLNIKEHEIEKFKEERSRWKYIDGDNPIENYSSSYWIIKVSSSYGEAKSSRMLHLVRRFGDRRPFVISYWQERAN